MALIMELDDFTIASQTKVFLIALLFGAALGVVYDVFRIFRLCFFQGKAAVFFQDILFGIITGIGVYLFLFVVNDGAVRGYIVLALILGFVFYYFSLGALVLKVSSHIICFLRKTGHWCYKVISAPFRGIFRIFRPAAKKLAKSTKNSSKNFTSKWKIHLKQKRLMLYNCFKKPDRGDQKKEK